ncbi:CRISPR-associated endonuclease Cas2 [Candidatus Roizmanbacteria bacterium]|nr:CRISPR-associated endonuclease Cas2 [Candidatus Roizmanbacteria bacterium]
MGNTKSRVGINGLTKALLMTLGTGVIIGAALIFPGAGLLYQRFKKDRWEQAKKRGLLKSTIRRLEKQRLISWKEKDGELQLTLEEKGKRKILQYKIDELRIKETSNWDGLFRIVTFDIPEDKRIAREMFRKKLTDLGFQKLQKSVFVIRFPCKGEVDFLRHSLEIAPYVLYIVAKDIFSLEKSQ